MNRVIPEVNRDTASTHFLRHLRHFMPPCRGGLDMFLSKESAYAAADSPEKNKS
jgi:hypothetical protein